MSDSFDQYNGLEIAVVGMSGRFPGADSVEELWDLLKNGKEGISRFTEDELIGAGVDEDEARHPDYVPAKGIMNDVSGFDHKFFGYSAKEARLLDPQVRIFLEIVWEALEDAGYNPYEYKQKIGMFAGANPNLYWTIGTYMTNAEDMGDFANKDLLSTRVSYKLNLKGPSYTVFTACSTSLVTIHQACRSLLGGECDMAVAGGISLDLPQKNGYMWQEGMILSKDGHNRSFDENATGAVFSNGAGVVVLKTLEDALRDNDNIYAVIKGTAVNNDGNRKVGYPAPSVKGQAEVIQDALHVAEVEPETISYVETHGSATAIGDPIEFEALTKAFDTSGKGYCGIGSVKSNLGHTNIASGVAGFIKTVLSLHNRTLPPNINYTGPNPKIDFANSPFYVVNEAKEWKGNGPLRAGVSSFGVGGTNAHAILEEAPKRTASPHSERPVLLQFSAKTPASLKAYESKLADYLENTSASLHDVAHTLQATRHPFAHRQTVVATNASEAIATLRDLESDAKSVAEVDEMKERKLVFMFPGQGSQYIHMGLGLYQTQETFRREVDRGIRLISDYYREDVRDIWFPRNGGEKDSFDNLINNTKYTQPLLFVFEYALGKTMQHLGIQPDALIGHSFGEFAAACLAEVFSFEDALRLVIRRGELIASLPENINGMLAVVIDEKDLLPLLPDSLDIAAVNTHQSCVVAGALKDIAAFKEKLEAEGYSCRQLRISNAFHSRMMQPILNEFEQAFRGVRFSEPKIPFMSNLEGKWATLDVIGNARYWVEHLRQAVRFGDGLKELLKQDDLIFVEVGPGQTLSTFVNQTLGSRTDCAVVNMSKHPKDEIEDEYYFLDRLGKLWVNGQNTDWSAYYKGLQRNRVSAPTYAFDKQEFWLDEESLKKKKALLNGGGEGVALNSMLYKPVWVKETLVKNTYTAKSKACLLFADQAGMASELIDNLEQRYTTVTCVESGEVNFYSREALQNIFTGIEEAADIVYMQALDNRTANTAGTIDHEQLNAFANLLEVAAGHNGSTSLTLVTRQSADVEWVEGPDYMNAFLFGMAKAVAFGKNNLSVKRIETTLQPEQLKGEKAEILSAEIAADAESEQFVFLKGRSRYVLQNNYSQAATAETVEMKNKQVTLIAEPVEDTLQTIQTLKGYGAEVRALIPGLENTGWPQTEASRDEVASYLRNTLATWAPSLEQTVGQAAKRSNNEINNTPEVQKLVDLIQQLSSAITAGYFAECGITIAEGQTYTIAELKSHLQIRPRFDKFFNYFLHILVEDNIAIQNGESITFTKSVAADDEISSIKVQIEADFADCIPVYNLVMHCAKHYKQALSGQIPAIGVLFPNGSSELLDSVSGSNVLFSNTGKYLQKVKDLVLHYVQGATSRKKVRILEVGAGRGELTKNILPALKGMEVEYYFTDLGQTFVNEAGKTFGGYDFVQFRQFDACADIESQGLEPYSFDLVVAMDVIHATPSLAGTIGNLQQLLTPGGWMMYVENTSPLRLVNLVWGLADGWWNFEDTDVRQKTPLAPVENWLQVIDSLNFGYAAAYDLQDETAMNDHELLMMQAASSEHNAAYQAYFQKKYQADIQETVGVLKSLARLQQANEIQVKAISTEQGAIDSSVENADHIVLQYAEPGIAQITMLNEVNALLESGRAGDAIFITALDTPAANITKYQGALQCGIAAYLRHLAQSEGTAWSLLRLGNLTNFASTELNKDLTLKNTQYRKVLLQAISKGADGETIISALAPDHLRNKVKECLQNTSIEIAELADEDQPQNETEAAICTIWKEAFGVAVSRTDNYFDLGGDSLMMVGVIARIEKALGIKVKVSEFYRHLTIASLARLIDSRQGEKVVEIQPAAKKASYAATAAQKTMFYLQFLHPESTSYNITQIIELYDNVDFDKLTDCFNTLLQRHESLRTIFRLEEGEPRQVILENQSVSPERYSITEATLRSTIDKFIKPYDLLKQPCFRVAYLKGEGKQYMVVDTHHIVFDGISIDVLKRELTQLYNDIDLSAQPLQFKDFAEWQASAEYRDMLESQRNFWFEKFSEPAPKLELPYDYEKKKFSAPEGDHFSGDLDGELFKRIMSLNKSQQTTLFSQLLAATYILLSKYTGVQDIVIGTGTKGRNFSDLDDVIGNFVNTVPMRTRPENGKTYTDFLAEVRETVNEAVENQDYLYEELITKLPFNQGKDDKTLFNVAVTLVTSSLVNQKEEQPVRLFKSYVDYFDSTSKFDIDINAVEKDDRITIVIEYASLLFRKQTIENFFNYYRQTLEIVTANPDIKLEDIELPGIRTELANAGSADGTEADDIFGDNFLNHKF